MAKPLLLLDVDGPLNPYAAPPHRRPEGYQTHRPTPTGWSRPLRVWLNPAHGPMLLALADRLELAWATTWCDDANRIIGPLIGLPELPVIPLEQPTRTSPAGQIWKRATVEQYVGDRAFAWLDDDFETDDLLWAKERTAARHATLLLHINPAVGIAQEDVDQVAAWSAALGSELSA